MSKDFNWKPYYIGVLVVSIIACIFSWKVALGIIMGSIYFYLNDKLNQKRFPKLDGKGKVIGSVMLIIFVQFLMICFVAIASYKIGKLETFFGAFAGMTIPHFYFIIKEIKNIKK